MMNHHTFLLYLFPFQELLNIYNSILRDTENEKKKKVINITFLIGIYSKPIVRLCFTTYLFRRDTFVVNMPDMPYYNIKF